MTNTASAILVGRRILIAEDEYMIADEVADTLSCAGVDVIGPAATVADALRFAVNGDAIDAALLDVNLRNEVIWPAVEVLLEQGVPVVLATGYDSEAIPPAYAHLPRCEKPSFTRDIFDALTRALESQSRRRQREGVRIRSSVTTED